MSAFLQGLLIGFSIAAPVGPIGLLCLRRSLADGRRAGFVSGLGAATADAVYGLIAAAGLTALMQALAAWQGWLQLGGGVFLVYLGIATLRARTPAATTRTSERTSLFSAYASTFALTLSNPMTILSFVGIFAGLGLGGTTHGMLPASLLVGGVFGGSAAWWLLLSTIAGWLGSRLQTGALRAVNLGSGAIIAGFGFWQLVALIRSAAWFLR